MHLMLMGKGRPSTGLAVEKKAAASTPTTGWEQVFFLGRDETAGRRVERPLRLSLHFSFYQQGHFFLTWTLPSRFRWLIILALTHRT